MIKEEREAIPHLEDWENIWKKGLIGFFKWNLLPFPWRQSIKIAHKYTCGKDKILN